MAGGIVEMISVYAVAECIVSSFRDKREIFLQICLMLLEPKLTPEDPLLCG
jgi:hypothetical protein